VSDSLNRISQDRLQRWASAGGRDGGRFYQRRTDDLAVGKPAGQFDQHSDQSRGGNFTQLNNAIALGTNETGPAAIASGVFRLTDVNHLTQPVDLVIANSTSNTVTVLLGNGDGTFVEAPGSPFTVGAQPRAVAIADFNGDGQLDFAVANSGDNSIPHFFGNGDGTFTPFPKSPFVLRIPCKSRWRW